MFTKFYCKFAYYIIIKAQHSTILATSIKLEQQKV